MCTKRIKKKDKKEKKKQVCYKYIPIREDDILPDDYEFLKERVIKQQTRGLPIFPSVELFNKLVADAVCEEWESLCLSLMDDTYALLEKFLEWAMEKVIPARLGSSRFAFTDIVGDSVRQRYEHAKKQAHIMLKEEKAPKTQDSSIFEHLMHKRTVPLMDELRKLKSQGNDNGTVRWEAVEAAMKEAQKKNLDCVDHSVKEMQIAFTAYGKVAVKRATDKAPNIVDNELLHNLQDDIMKKSSITSDKELKDMLRVDDGTLRRRGELEEGISKYDNAMKAFHLILTSHSIGDL